MSKSKPADIRAQQYFTPIGVEVVSLSIGQSHTVTSRAYVHKAGQVKVSANVSTTLTLTTVFPLLSIVILTVDLLRDGLSIIGGPQILSRREQAISVVDALTLTTIDSTAQEGQHDYTLVLTNSSETAGVVIGLESLVLSTKALRFLCEIVPPVSNCGYPTIGLCPLIPTVPLIPLPVTNNVGLHEGKLYATQDYPVTGTPALIIEAQSDAKIELPVEVPHIGNRVACAPSTSFVSILDPTPNVVRLEANLNILLPVGNPGGTVLVLADILRGDGTSVTGGPQAFITDINPAVSDNLEAVNLSLIATDSLVVQGASTTYTLSILNSSSNGQVVQIDFYSFSAETTAAPPEPQLAALLPIVLIAPKNPCAPIVEKKCYNNPFVAPAVSGSSLYYRNFESKQSVAKASVNSGSIGPFVQQFPPVGTVVGTILPNRRYSLTLDVPVRAQKLEPWCEAHSAVKLSANLNLLGDFTHILVLFEFTRDGESLTNGPQTLVKVLMNPASHVDITNFTVGFVDKLAKEGCHSYSFNLINLSPEPVDIDFISFNSEQ